MRTRVDLTLLLPEGDLIDGPFVLAQLRDFVETVCPKGTQFWLNGENVLGITASVPPSPIVKVER